MLVVSFPNISLIGGTVITVNERFGKESVDLKDQMSKDYIALRILVWKTPLVHCFSITFGSYNIEMSLTTLDYVYFLSPPHTNPICKCCYPNSIS